MTEQMGPNASIFHENVSLSHFFISGSNKEREMCPIALSVLFMYGSSLLLCNIILEIDFSL